MTQERGNPMQRRHFLATAALLGVPLETVARPTSPWPVSAEAASAYPQQDRERVQSVVGASHGNFDRVETLVSAQPALAKASWDWGFGDWETALGAASHTGRRKIAEFLIDHGARPTLFSAAMLGQVDAVRALLAARPGLHLLHGPHGISLTRHAQAGGTQAQDVLAYLTDTFGPDEAVFGVAGDASLQHRYSGRYRFDGDPALEISVGIRNGWLMAGPGTEPNGRVIRLSQDVFHPAGAPAVRLEFEVVDGRARTLQVSDGPVRLVGTKFAELSSGA